MLNINSLRKEYLLKSLDINNIDPDPFLQFNNWFLEAEKAQIQEVNAMTLATTTSHGRPSCRTVLLKGIDEKGFLFFTNYESRKGKDLAENPMCCVTFFWKELERQIIIEGKAEKLSLEHSQAYFSSRPRRSQIGAWASCQGQVISSRGELENSFLYFERLYEGKNIPMPPYWGGYRIIPERFEFWQGRENRLHDRFRYTLIEGIWKIDRLAP